MTKEELYSAVEASGATIDSDNVQETLDSLVHDTKSQEASNLNNEGYIAQLDYLLEAGIPLDELQKMLGL